MKTLQFILIGIIFFGFFSACSPSKKFDDEKYLIPRPMRFGHNGPDGFVVDKETPIILQSDQKETKETAELLAGIIEKIIGTKPQIQHFEDINGFHNSILLSTYNADSALGAEGYKLTSSNSGLVIQANTQAGLFYGIQSLLQLIPIEFHFPNTRTERIKLPAINITDKPRFSYRGMHLDVSRHFFGPDFIKKYLDLMATFKMNVFHWHLTDDNGWRIEIKKYPELTGICAWHVDRDQQNWRQHEPPKPGEKATKGGFYTQDEIKDIIAYAAKRHILIIPEIEMPGHSSEIFAAYPELSCRGKKLDVQSGSYWPNTDILCAGNDGVFEFIENVLDEVASLFPGPYIHIGGDEADKTQWKQCKKCQTRIKKENLKDENELQSWFIHKAEEILTARGKKLIGWDEILEGGLSPGATVMSWRGMEGGIEAATQGHDVIMTPTSHCYFDYYQADPETEPEAIGGFLTLKKVYEFNPIPPSLDESNKKHILGAQGNIWTEYMATESHVLYMAIPRMLAMAEVCWSQENRIDYQDFRRRLRHHFQIFDSTEINYSKGSYKTDMTPAWNSTASVYYINLNSEQFEPLIKYTLDGREPNMQSKTYDGPVRIENSLTIKSGIFENDKIKEKSTSYDIIIHKGLGGKTKLVSDPYFKYSAQGGQTLTDGICGGLVHNNGQWLGFKGDDLEYSLQFDQPKSVDSIAISFLENQAAWIFKPTNVVIEVSDDDKTFKPLTVKPILLNKNEKAGYWRYSTKVNANVKSIRLKVKNQGICPENHIASGEIAWLFADELIVY
ncbi:MAG: family 20 glycosylhydrolase [Bacteroidales bacterium]|nr:family 20 glycosylhydrolase [Bacteroidales bacterium]